MLREFDVIMYLISSLARLYTSSSIKLQYFISMSYGQCILYASETGLSYTLLLLNMYD